MSFNGRGFPRWTARFAQYPHCGLNFQKMYTNVPQRGKFLLILNGYVSHPLSQPPADRSPVKGEPENQASPLTGEVPQCAHWGERGEDG